jgi:hypothetical protein
MRIQEMRSGLAHLKKRPDEERQNIFFGVAAAEALSEPVESENDPATKSELNEPRWSVVSFERREASGLTYEEAVRLMQQLEEKNVSGLCVVTDEAAGRID